MNKVAVIFNPKSGQEKLMPLKEEILQKLNEKFGEVILYETKASGDGAEFVKIAADDSCDMIIAAGGDGTVYEVTNALSGLDERPVLGIIPGGTCNDFSRAMNLPQDPLKAVETILDLKAQQVDVGHDGSQYFLNFWGIGLISQISENIDDETKEKVGRLSYYMSAYEQVRDPDSFHYSITLPDELLEGEAVLLVVANGPFAGGVRPFFKDIKLDDGDLNLLIIKEASFRTAMNILRNKEDQSVHDEEDGIIHRSIKEMKIETSPHQLIDCDGERTHETPSEIKVLPCHLKVIAGER